MRTASSDAFKLCAVLLTGFGATGALAGFGASAAAVGAGFGASLTAGFDTSDDDDSRTTPGIGATPVVSVEICTGCIFCVCCLKCSGDE